MVTIQMQLRANAEKAKREKRQSKDVFYYLEYVNNFVTIKGFAEYFDMDLETAISHVTAGRLLNESGTTA